jgi:hypothetical protein
MITTPADLRISLLQMFFFTSPSGLRSSNSKSRRPRLADHPTATFPLAERFDRGDDSPNGG